MRLPRIGHSLRPGPRHGAPAAGFTLIEIMVVVIVLAILAGSIMPNFHGTMAGLRLKTAAGQIGEVMDYCYYEAIAEGRVYGLIFNADGVHYRVLAEARPRGETESDSEDKKSVDPGLAAATATDSSEEPRLEPVSLPLQETALPEGVRLGGSSFFEEDLATANGDDLRILFFPDGTTEFATLTLEAMDGSKLDVLLNGVSGAVRIEEPESKTNDSSES